MSRIADEIVKEYKIRKAFEKRKRQVCREQEKYMINTNQMENTY